MLYNYKDLKPAEKVTVVKVIDLFVCCFSLERFCPSLGHYIHMGENVL